MLSDLTTMTQHFVVVLLLTSLSSGVRLAMVSVSIVSFLPLLFPPYSLSMFSVNSLQFLLSFAVVLYTFTLIPRIFLQNPLIKTSVFLASFSLHFLGSLPISYLSFSPHEQPTSNATYYSYLKVQKMIVNILFMAPRMVYLSMIY